MRFTRLARLFLGPAMMLTVAGAAIADPVEDFYRGKTIRLMVGFPVGGSFDLYSRAAAEFLGRHIPGKPSIVVQNMIGGSSLVAAKFLHGAAPRDGSVIGMYIQTLALDVAIMGDKAGVDVTQMPYLGRLATSVEIGFGLPGAKFSTFADARNRELITGTSGTSDAGFLLASALNAYAGAKFKIVRGYRAAVEIRHAAEQGEVEFVPASGLAGLMVSNPDWITGRKAAILYQAALHRHPLLPHVPTVAELGLDEEGRAILRLIASTGDIGRALSAPPGLPADRLATLRKAFMDMAGDPEFRQKMAERNIAIEPAPGEAIDAIARETAATPRVLLDKIAALANP